MPLFLSKYNKQVYFFCNKQDDDHIHVYIIHLSLDFFFIYVRSSKNIKQFSLFFISILKEKSGQNIYKNEQKIVEYIKRYMIIMCQVLIPSIARGII